MHSLIFYRRNLLTNFTISYHSTDIIAKPRTVKICTIERDVNLKIPFNGVYKIINSTNTVVMSVIHMILSLDKRLMETTTSSMSELFTLTKNKLASMITESPIERATDALSGFCDNMK